MLVLGETSGTKFSTEQNVPRTVTIDRGWILYAVIGSIGLDRALDLTGSS